MNKQSLKVGAVYRAKHTSGFINVRLEKIAVWHSEFSGVRSRTRYICTNLKTGREIVFKSPGHLLREVE